MSHLYHDPTLNFSRNGASKGLIPKTVPLVSQLIALNENGAITYSIGTITKSGVVDRVVDLNNGIITIYINKVDDGTPQDEITIDKRSISQDVLNMLGALKGGFKRRRKKTRSSKNRRIKKKNTKRKR